MKKTSISILLALVAFIMVHSSFASEHPFVLRGNALYFEELIYDAEGWGATGEVGYIFHEGKDAEHLIGFETGFILGEEGTSGISSDILYIPMLFNYTLSSKPNDNRFFYEVGAGIGLWFVSVENSFSSLTSDDDEFVFGGQLFGRVGYELAENFGITGGVRFIFTDDADLFGIKEDLNTLGFELGLKYAF